MACDISKATALGPLRLGLVHTFLYRMNTSGVKNRLLLRMVENVKS